MHFIRHRYSVRLISLLLMLACGCSSFELLPFRDPTLQPDIRIRDLLSRLNNSEIIEQLSRGGAGKTGGPAPAISRLGLLPFQWNTECLHGVAEAGNATSFPQSIGLAATGSRQLVAAMAYAVALEARASNNVNRRRGIFSDHTGINCFAPVINIMRHPFWGRNQETYGEDPFLSGVLGAAYVRGLQGDSVTARQLLGDWGSRYAPAGANCKHFDAYAGPENTPESRFVFDAKVPEQDLHQTFLPAFRRCTEAGSHGVMCSYNSVNGVPACANRRLLTNILRQEWQFDGFVVSDEGALKYMVDFHKYFNNYTEAAIGALEAGVNLNLSPDCPDDKCVVYEYLHKAVANGRVTRHQLTQAARPLFLARLRLGEFDPPGWNPYEQLQPSDFVQSQRHRQLSAQLAAATIVLLKNLNEFLPLQLSGLKVGLLGPFAADMSLAYGSYSAVRMPEFETSLPDGLRLAGADVTTATFCLDGVFCRRQNASAVSTVVKNSDVVVAAIGTGTPIETEGHDRESLMLPDGQNQLLLSLAATGKPLLLLVFSSGPVLLDWAVTNQSVRAILWCGFPGQAAGLGVAASLTGAAPPFARLPFTWYSADQQLMPITNYTITNMTYRFLPQAPLFPFGFGLTHSNCRVSLERVIAPSQLPIDNDLPVNFTASLLTAYPHTGCLYSARLYLRPVHRVNRNPLLWLAAVRLLPWETGVTKQQVQLRVLSRDMQQWYEGAMRILPGEYDVIIGDYFDEKCQDCRLLHRLTIF